MRDFGLGGSQTGMLTGGPYGIDGQMLRNVEFSCFCRFPNRAFAAAWAELERQPLERQHDVSE